MMKKAIWITVICVLAVMLFAACSNSADEDIAVNESETVSSSAGNVSSDETITESAELSTNTEEQNSADAQQNTSGSSTSNTKNTTAARREGANTAAEATTKRQTAAQKQTTTKKQTTTTTTKKTTTTQKPTTTASQELTESDMQWIQSEAHKYMKSKGASINSSVGSFSSRISTKDKSRSEVLAEVKEWIDFEYTECMNSGWNVVSMYCKYEKRSNGSYFIYVMYG